MLCICCSHLTENIDECALSTHHLQAANSMSNRNSQGRVPWGGGTYCAAGALLRALWRCAAPQHGPSRAPQIHAPKRPFPPPRSPTSSQGCSFPDRVADPCRQPGWWPPLAGSSHWRGKAARGEARGASLPLPMTCTLSFGAGCCGNRWHGLSRSSPDRAGNCDTAGSGSETPSCSRCGSRNTRRGGRLRRRETPSFNPKQRNPKEKLTDRALNRRANPLFVCSYLQRKMLFVALTYGELPTETCVALHESVLSHRQHLTNQAPNP